LSWENKFEKHIDLFKQGDIASLSKMISLVENNVGNAWEIISKLPKNTNNSQIIGITGSPGAGKSTLVSKVVDNFVSENQKVAVLAVDPSSPFSGGAFLGDRIRMRNISKSENVYIRSVASRGSVGGLCDSIYDIVDVLISFGFEKIIVETVGAGQSEIEVVYVADTILLVMSPDGGDEIQLFKAGIMEIADSYIVNKCDLTDSNKFLIYLKNTLSLESEEKSQRKIFPVSAIMNTGIKELTDWIEEHKIILKETGKINDIEKRRTKRRVRSNLIRILDKITNDYQPENESLVQTKNNYIKKLIEEANYSEH
jgi:LAO/AO transport system kinase